MVEDILVVFSGGCSENAADAAFRAAHYSSRKVKVLQILYSDLYRYAQNDPVASPLIERRFLLYIRDQVIERGEVEAQKLIETAGNMDVNLEITPVETDDVISAVITEAKKGYEIIYLAKEKKRVLPLLQKHLATELRKQTAGKVIEC